MDKISDEKRLQEDLAAACKLKEQQLIGIEHEMFLFSHQDHRPLPYAGRIGIHSLLIEMQRFGWQPSCERDRLTGLEKDGAAITLEPAGQFELSGSPWADLHGVHEEMREHRRQLAELAGEMDLGTLALGFAPQWRPEELDWMPKSRYHIMRDYMPKVGVHGIDMMTRTCALQINMDFCSEADMRDKYRVAMALQPLVMVALANSPFADDRDSPLTSYRNYVWLHTDSARCGILPLMMSAESGFADYVRRALATPMYSVERQGAHVDLAGRSFRDMMQGALHELPGERPTPKDWKDHLNTLMFDVRLKDHLELRGNDSLPLEESMALIAFWTGILYDEASLHKALAFIEGCEPAALNLFRHNLPGVGLADSDRLDVGGVYSVSSFLEALEYTTDLALEGLRRRQRVNAENADESAYLQPLRQIIEERLSPAEQWRRRLHREWQGDLAALYRQASF
jgi:glutamate--cysteine ligase